MIGQGNTLLLATRNRGKTKEFREAFERIGIAVKDLHDVKGVPDIEETGDTFADNALLKAKAVAHIVGLPVLADDSGLCVDALGGAPGVFSARYAGEGAGDSANNKKLLHELELRSGANQQARTAGRAAGIERGQEPELLSTARFVCALVLFDPSDGSKLEAEGAVEGHILRESRGTDGFGYDPLFWVSSHGRSMAELSLEEKNAISHRGQALRLSLALIGK